jgi:DNA-binding CsgD family transcriptional regulator
LWQGEPLAARRAVAEALGRLDDRQASVRYVGAACALGIRAEAYLAASARARHAEAELDESRSIGAALLARAAAIVVDAIEHRPYYTAIATTALALARAEHTRLEGPPDPAAWAGVASGMSGDPYMRAYALMRQGEAILASRGDAETAIEALREAGGIAIRLGAEPLRRAVEALATVSPRPHPAATVAFRTGSAGPYELSPRELEVVRLVAVGRSDGEIATALFISKKTASVHVANIKGKLGAQSRVEIAINAIGLGLVEAPASRA